jgi:hypothetical protein
MFTVLDPAGQQLFQGFFSAMNAFVIDSWGTHAEAILAGARIVPPASVL